MERNSITEGLCKEIPAKLKKASQNVLKENTQPVLFKSANAFPSILTKPLHYRWYTIYTWYNWLFFNKTQAPFCNPIQRKCVANLTENIQSRCQNNLKKCYGVYANFAYDGNNSTITRDTRGMERMISDYQDYRGGYQYELYDVDDHYPSSLISKIITINCFKQEHIGEISHFLNYIWNYLYINNHFKSNPWRIDLTSNQYCNSLSLF